MKLKSIGTVVNALCGKNFDPFGDEGQYEAYNKVYDKVFDERDALMENSDIVFVTLDNGSKYIMSEINFLGGVCDCCSQIRGIESVKQWEGFKLETES